MTDISERVARQIAFIAEADRLKSVVRRTPLTDGSRWENAGEHSWHVILAAMVLGEHAAVQCDMLRVLQMLAVHDLVEIDAGDTSPYDAAEQAGRIEREKAAAERVFGLLPPDQKHALRALWEEFEAHETADARFAHAVDRMQPLVQAAFAAQGSWTTETPPRGQLLKRMSPVESAAPAMWTKVLAMIDALY